MQTYITDASVAIKWYFDEEGKEPAVHLLNQFKEKKATFVVPEIFYSEFANTCAKKVKKKMAVSSEVLAVFDDLLALRLKRHSDHELSDVALENALHLGITVYDALYISLAEIYVSPLITADDALIKACRRRFDFILPLWEFK